jgi:hypothetical protein
MIILVIVAGVVAVLLYASLVWEEQHKNRR